MSGSLGCDKQCSFQKIGKSPPPPPPQVTMETTIGNYNTTLWQYVTPNSVLENYRVVVANRLATSGKEWTTIFGQHNSGTYASYNILCILSKL